MILPNPDEFTYKDVVVGGDPCWLITPNHIGTKWTSDNERFRSIIIRKSDNHVVSHGLKKFTNFLETPTFQPWNNAWKVQGRYKYDGSCGIISKYKGEIIFRTRGTVDARSMPNGSEVDQLIAKYPKLFDNDLLNSETVTIITEWCTPTNIICIKEFPESTLVLLNIIVNETGEYFNQNDLDELAKKWDVVRPQVYEYDSIADCFADVEAWVGKEGVVLYSPDFQTLKKIKSEHYLSIHKLAMGMRSVWDVLEVFINSPRPSTVEEFSNYVETTVNYEVAIKIEEEIKKVITAYNRYQTTIQGIEGDMPYTKQLETRKDQAQHLKEKWGREVSLAFEILSHGVVDERLFGKTMKRYIEEL